MKLKTKSFWYIILLSASIIILMVLAVMFIIEPKGYIIILALPLIFTISYSVYFLRSNNKNFKTIPKFKTRIFFTLAILAALYYFSMINMAGVA